MSGEGDFLWNEAMEQSKMKLKKPKISKKQKSINDCCVKLTEYQNSGGFDEDIKFLQDHNMYETVDCHIMGISSTYRLAQNIYKDSNRTWKKSYREYLQSLKDIVTGQKKFYKGLYKDFHENIHICDVCGIYCSDDDYKWKETLLAMFHCIDPYECDNLRNMANELILHDVVCVYIKRLEKFDYGFEEHYGRYEKDHLQEIVEKKSMCSTCNNAINKMSEQQFRTMILKLAHSKSDEHGHDYQQREILYG